MVSSLGNVCWVITWSPARAKQLDLPRKQPQAENNLPAKQPGGTDWRQGALSTQAQLSTEA